MKTITTTFRGETVLITYQDTMRGIMLSWVGTDGENLVDTITRKERNTIINTLLEVE